MTTAHAAFMGLALVVAGATAAAQEQSEQRPVEITAASTDAPTVAVKTAVTEAFKLSPYFRISTGAQPGTLMVVFPKEVEARTHMGRTEYLYRVEFRATNGRLLEQNWGSCWADDVQKCVFNVLKIANRVMARG